MINRRQMLAGFLAAVTLPRLPAPASGGTCYIVFEPIPLEHMAKIKPLPLETVQRIESYFSVKYGIGLPAAHPFYGEVR